MAYKAQLEEWSKAVTAYDEGDVNLSLRLFRSIASTSRMLYNVALLLYEQSRYEDAIDVLSRAIMLDKYFALGYFLRGACLVKLYDWEAAIIEFRNAYIYLRGNSYIDYHQIGCNMIIYDCEILYNRALCYIRLDDYATAVHYLKVANKARVKRNKHQRIGRAYEDPDNASSLPFFEIACGKLFRPGDDKLKNVPKRDYLGKSMLIRTANAKDTHTGFRGTIDRRPRAESVASSTSLQSRSRFSTAQQQQQQQQASVLKRSASRGRPKAPKLPGQRSSTHFAYNRLKTVRKSVSDVSLSSSFLSAPDSSSSIKTPDDDDDDDDDDEGSLVVGATNAPPPLPPPPPRSSGEFAAQKKSKVFGYLFSKMKNNDGL